MGTANRVWEQERKRQRRPAAHRRTAGGRHTDRAVLGPAEKRRLMQLVVCLALFFAVFFGKGIFPERMSELRVQLLSAIRQDTDFEAAFSALGQAVSEGEPVTEALGILWGDGLEESGDSFYDQQAAILCGLQPAQAGSPWESSTRIRLLT